VAARPWWFAGGADNFGGAQVEVCLEGVGFGRFGKVAVKIRRVVNLFATLTTTGDVLGAIVTVGDHVTVKATTATGRAPLANLCDRVGGAVKGAGYAVEKGAHGVPVKAGGVI
jgi:hypothetical protein